MNNYIHELVSNGYNALYSMVYPVNQVMPTNIGNKPIYEIPLFPQDVWNEVLKHSKSDLVALACASQSLNQLTNDYAKNNLPAGCFGAKEWKSYGADPGLEPSIPLKLYAFDSSKWMLTFIPETINNEPLTLSSMDRVVSDFKNGKDAFKSNYQFPLNDFGIDDKTVKPFKAHFVMLSKDVLGGTRNENFATQEKLVKEAGFEIPNLIDTVVSVLLHNLQTGDFVYPGGSNGHRFALTRVQEQNSNGYQIVVGGFSALGLIVFDYDGCDSGFIGASCSGKSLGA